MARLYAVRPDNDEFLSFYSPLLRAQYFFSRRAIVDTMHELVVFYARNQNDQMCAYVRTENPAHADANIFFLLSN